MKLFYELKVIDEDEDAVIIKVSSYSEEGLEEEMGKSKIAKAIAEYKEIKLGQLAREDEEPEKDREDDFRITKEDLSH